MGFPKGGDIKNPCVSPFDCSKTGEKGELGVWGSFPGAVEDAEDPSNPRNGYDRFPAGREGDSLQMAKMFRDRKI